MGKKILNRLLEQSSIEESKKDTSILDSLLGQAISEKREEALSQGVTESFQAESQYDKDLGFGINQNKLRARNQPFYDQLGNSLAKVVPGAALAVVESIGDIGELLDDQKDKDYANIFTELAKKGKEALNEPFTTYQEGDPNKLPSLHDSGWWFNFGDGIVQSLAGFYVVGAGLGATLARTAKVVTGALKSGELATQVGQGAAQLATATALSYTEGVQIGGEVYKNVYDQGIKDGLDKDSAKQKASESAAETVKLNTLLATPLNITGLSSVFKSYSKLSLAVKAQLPRAVGESIPKYIERLSILEKTIPQATGIKDIALATLREGSQEAFEEGGINLYAESEGYRKAGNRPDLVRSKLDDGIERFADILFSEEGAVNALGGAVGGVFQHLGLEHTPLSKYNNQRVSSTRKEQLEEHDYKGQLVSTLKQDLGTIQKNQQDLNDALITGDKTKIEIARGNMFNITALRSIRNETVKELANEIGQIGSADNTQIKEDGLTDAQRQGLSENIDDNKYKETAARKSADLIKLNKEYRDLQTRFGDRVDNFTTQEIFRKRLDLYNTESVLQDLNKSAVENESNLLTTLPLEEITIAKYKAEQLAYDNAMFYQQANKNEEAVKLLKSERVQVDALYKDTVKQNPELSTKIDNKLNLLQPLVSDYVNKLVLQNIVNKQKEEYANILNNPEKFKKEEVTPRVEEYKKRQEKDQKEKDTKEAKIKQEVEYKEAQVKKASQERKRIALSNIQEEDQRDEASGNSLYTSFEGDNQFQGLSKEDVQQQIEDFYNNGGKRVEQPISNERSLFDILEEQILGVDQLNNLTPVLETYTPPTIKEREEQDKLIDEELTNQNNLNTPSYGNHNKIAYKAQEQDESGKTIDIFTISNLYKILHSSTIREGTNLSLKIAIDSKFYEANKDSIEKMPIGVYYQDNLVGFLPIYIEGKDRSLLLARNYIIKNKEVETKVSRKTAGILNKGDKALVSENYAFTPKFLVGRNGNFELSLDNIFEGDLLNNQSSKSGYLYTLNSAPNNKQIALPIDIDKIDSDLSNSLMKVLDLYFKKGNKDNENTLNEEEKTLIKSIQNEYSQDISTLQGLNWFFNQIFTETDLTSKDKGQDNIDKISKDQRSKNIYIQVIPAGLKIISNPGATIGTGGSPIIYGRNDIDNKQKREMITSLLSNTYYKADLTKLNSNKEFKFPILNLENNQFSNYTKKNYNEHLASITRTNIISVNIGNNQQTVFVQPTINISFDFLNKPSKENLDFQSEDKLKFVSLGKPEKVILATLDEYNSNDFEQVEETMTEEQKEEYKRKCKP